MGRPDSVPGRGRGAPRGRPRGGRGLRGGLAFFVAIAGWGGAQRLAAQAAPALGASDVPGIRVVGHFDPASGRTTYRVAEPLAGREVLALQRALLRAGVSPGTPDGRLGRATRAALRRFQTERGLRPCGCPSYETVLALGLAPRVGRVVVGAAAGAEADPGVRVVRPQGITARAGGAGGPPTGEGAEREGTEADGPVRAAPAAPGYWVPVIVPGLFDLPGAIPAPPPGTGAPPVPPRAPRGASPPGIRPAPPPRASPPPPTRARPSGRSALFGGGP